jgi:hypothetical protein
MEINKYNKRIKFLFFIIWVFFILRVVKIIHFQSTITNFSFNDLIFALADVISLVIFLSFIVYLIISTYMTKKVSFSLVLILYPIFSLIGYYLNDFKNLFQEAIMAHHFITLTSVFIYFHFIQSNKIFDYKFKKLLFNTVIVFFFIYTLLIIFPDIINKIKSYQDLRFSYASILNVFGNKIYLNQNVNGQTKFLIILVILSFVLFKKYYFKNIIRSHLFFLIGLLLLTLIYLMQARFNILASYIFLFFLILTFNDLSLQRKIIYLLITIILPLCSFNLYTEKNSRFKDIRPLKYEIQGQGETTKEKINDYTNINIKQIDEYNEFVNNFINNSIEKSEEIVVEKSEEIVVEKSEEIVVEKSEEIVAEKSEEIVVEKSEEIVVEKSEEIVAEKSEEIEHKLRERANFLNAKSANEIENVNNQIKIDIHLNDTIYIKYLLLRRTLSELESILLEINSTNYYKNENQIREMVRFINKPTEKLYNYILTNCKFRKLDGILSGRVCGWEILLQTATIKSIFFGKGFFADQVYLKIPLYKTASNSWINIFNNSGLFSLFIFVSITLIFLIKFFKMKNFQDKNICVQTANYLIIYFLTRSLLEDTIAFVSFDFLLLGISMILIKEKNLKIS